MAPWSLELLIDQATADRPPPSADPESRYVRLTVEYQVGLIPPAVPEMLINCEVTSDLMSHQDFLANIEVCYNTVISLFNVELPPGSLAEYTQMSREIIAGNPNRRVLPLRLLVRGETHFSSVDAIENYLLDFQATLNFSVNNSLVDSLEYVSDEGTTREEDECSICLEELVETLPNDDGVDRRIVRTPCLHVFHKICIVKWLEKNPGCPMCRFSGQ